MIDALEQGMGTRKKGQEEKVQVMVVLRLEKILQKNIKVIMIYVHRLWRGWVTEKMLVPVK